MRPGTISAIEDAVGGTNDRPAWEGGYPGLIRSAAYEDLAVLGRVIIYIGLVFVGLMLLLQRPVPMAVAPNTDVDFSRY